MPNMPSVRAMLAFLLCTTTISLRHHPFSDLRAHVSSTFRDTGRAPQNLQVSLKFIVPHEKAPERKAALEELFWQVSDPDHAKHAQYKNRDDVNRDFLAPSRASHDALHAWLGAGGVDDNRRTSGSYLEYVSASMTVSEAEKLLNTELLTYERKGSNSVRVIAQRAHFRGGRFGTGTNALEEASRHPMADHVVEFGVVGEYTRQASIVEGIPSPGQPRRVCDPHMQTLDVPSSFTLYPMHAPWYAMQSVNQTTSNYVQGGLGVQFNLDCLIAGEPFHYDGDGVMPLAAKPPSTQRPASATLTDYVSGVCGGSSELAEYTITVSRIDGSVAPGSTTYTAQQLLDMPLSTLTPEANGVGLLNFTGIPLQNGSTFNEVKAVASLQLQFDTETTFKDYEQHSITITQKLKNGKTGSATYSAVVPYANGTLGRRVLPVTPYPMLTPPTLRDFYTAPLAVTACASHGTTQAIGVAQHNSSGYYSHADLLQFYDFVGGTDLLPNDALLHFESFPVLQTQGSSTLASQAQGGINGPLPVYNDGGDPGGETTLDVQWSSGVAPGAQSRAYHAGYFVVPELWNTGDGSYVGLFSAMYYAASPTLPHAVSISYGGPEPETLGGGYLEYAAPYLNELWQKMGVAGSSVFYAAGDTGAHFALTPSAPGGCAANGLPSGCTLYPATSPFKNCAKFTPSWPATSPYLTAVSATQLVADSTSPGGHKEVVCDIATGAWITAGGGFSTLFPQPAYQKDAVTSYLNSDVPKPPANWPGFNASNRGYPDVVVFGHNFKVVQGGSVVPTGGTSAASPSMMGLVTLINDALLAQGRPTLGFLNPKLYALAKSSPSAFTDITDGDNRCLGQMPNDQVCCEQGYTAGTGWDPVSGLGSIVYNKIKPLLMAQMPAAPAGVATPPGCTTVRQSVCQQTCGPGYVGPFVQDGHCEASGTCTTKSGNVPGGAHSRKSGSSDSLALGLGLGLGLGLPILACLCRSGQRSYSGRMLRGNVADVASPFEHYSEL